MKHYLSIISIALLISCNNSDDNSIPEEQFCGIFEGSITLPYDDAIKEFGFCNYTEITGDLIILESSYAFTITDLSPLSSITKVGGLLRIGPLRELNNLNGLHNIESADRLEIAGAEAIVNMDDLDKLQTNRIEFSHNYALENIDGLNMDLDTISVVAFQDCPSLTNLNGLLNIKTISSALIIDGCDSLINLQGLNNVESIGQFNGASCCGSLVIENNFFLESLDGLENLTYLKGDIVIRENTYLKSFCGLKNLFLADGHIGEYTVYDNYYNYSPNTIINICE